MTLHFIYCWLSVGQSAVIPNSYMGAIPNFNPTLIFSGLYLVVSLCLCLFLLPTHTNTHSLLTHSPIGVSCPLTSISWSFTLSSLPFLHTLIYSSRLSVSSLLGSTTRVEWTLYFACCTSLTGRSQYFISLVFAVEVNLFFPNRIDVDWHLYLSLVC